jgi:hypothetical protein
VVPFVAPFSAFAHRRFVWSIVCEFGVDQDDCWRRNGVSLFRSGLDAHAFFRSAAIVAHAAQRVNKNALKFLDNLVGRTMPRLILF